MWLGDKSSNNGPPRGSHFESMLTKKGNDIYGVGLRNRMKHELKTTVF